MVLNNIYFFAAGVLLLSACNSPEGGTNNRGAADQSGVDSLMMQMTLDEKVGQMTQLTLDMILVGEPYAAEEPHRIDPEKLEKVVVDMNVGSILNCGGHGYSRQFWLETITSIQEAANRSSSHIPVLYGIDAIHGVNYTNNATLFPQQIGLACSWDTTKARELAAMSAYETRASGIRWNFSPVLDIARDPRWPRFWESFGEDVKLVTDMGVKMVEGYQGDSIGKTHVAACLKHFLGYSQTLSGKDRTQAWIPDRQLREYFLPQFQAAIDAGAMTIMVNSGELNGIPVHANPVILTDLLRDELGFEGMVVTDWEDIKYLVSRHRVAADYKEAIKLAIDAGIDMSMVPTDLEFTSLLKELVEEGSISEERIDQSVRRILVLKERLGLFENATAKLKAYPDFASAEHRQMALDAAKASIVLLKNENTLPIKENERLLIVGKHAKSLNALNGGWTHTWQGVDTTLNTEGMPDFLEAMKESFTSVTYMNEEQFLAARSFNRYDKVIAVLGEMPYTETVGDIEDLNLPAQQLAALKKAAGMPIPSTLLLIEGRPRTMGELPSGLDAVLLAMLPGDQGGRALTEIIKGAYNPSGHLAFTYPKHPSSHTTYDHKYTDRIDVDFSLNAVDPLFSFGDGLSYTQFEYTDLELVKDSLATMNDTLAFTVTIRNIGEIFGEDVLQVYVSDSVASIAPAVKRLRAYRKIGLEAGQSEKVEFSIPVRDLAFVNARNEWEVEPGVFSVTVEDLTSGFTVK